MYWVHESLPLVPKFPSKAPLEQVKLSKLISVPENQDSPGISFIHKVLVKTEWEGAWKVFTTVPSTQ